MCYFRKFCDHFLLTSAELFHLKLWIKSSEFYPGIFCLKLPVNGFKTGAALSSPEPNLIEILWRLGRVFKFTNPK